MAYKFTESGFETKTTTNAENALKLLEDWQPSVIVLDILLPGIDGSMTTIHSNNPRDCIRRIETLVMMAGFDLPMQAIREQIAAAVNLIVQLKRYSDGSRKISHITEVIGIEGDTVVTQPIFEYKQTGTDEKLKVKGNFQPSGLIPKFVEQLKQKGIAPPKGLFTAAPRTAENTPTRGMTPTPASPADAPPKPMSPRPTMPPRPGVAGTKTSAPIKNPHGIKKP
jgi:CheY-like chemotaxis protein